MLLHRKVIIFFFLIKKNEDIFRCLKFFRKNKKFTEEIEIDEAVGWKLWKKRRNVVVVLAFFGFFTSYILRVNLSTAIVAMTTSSSGVCY